MKKIIIIVALAIVLLAVFAYYSQSGFNSLLPSDDDADSGTSGGTSDTGGGSDSSDDADSSTGGHWASAGTASEWTFIGGGDYGEWSLNFEGDDTLTGDIKVEISRRWNFKDVFECGEEGSVVWCLHDSYDNRIWHREDTSTILNYVTDTVNSGVFDGRPWTFIIGNNYSCDIDPHWSVTLYVWEE